jgi:hypothetical protein
MEVSSWWGKWRRRGAGLFRLLTRGGEQQTMASAGAAAARAWPRKKKALVGRWWAEMPKRVGPVQKFSKENGSGFKYGLGRNGNWAVENLFRIFFKAFGFKSKNSNKFKLNLNWSQTRIISNKLFEEFSNLETWNLILNNQL